jgi:hypothetical protein
MAVGDGVFLWIASKDTGIYAIPIPNQNLLILEEWEAEIDDRVANLYGLTAEEMKTIRGY